MRTLTITLATAFVFLLAQQLPAASDGPDREKGGASQAVITGNLLCDPQSTGAALNTFGGLGVLAIPTTSFNVFIDHDEDCLPTSSLRPPVDSTRRSTEPRRRSSPEMSGATTP